MNFEQVSTKKLNTLVDSLAWEARGVINRNIKEPKELIIRRQMAKTFVDISMRLVAYLKESNPYLYDKFGLSKITSEISISKLTSEDGAGNKLKSREDRKAHFSSQMALIERELFDAFNVFSNDDTFDDLEKYSEMVKTMIECFAVEIIFRTSVLYNLGPNIGSDEYSDAMHLLRIRSVIGRMNDTKSLIYVKFYYQYARKCDDLYDTLRDFYNYGMAPRHTV
jgi:hypothetical protein